jgi:hypothetical protein
MKISLEYESSWRNSFLDGSNNEPLPKKGRKFIGSIQNLKTAENFKQRNITLDTVMGVLNRLIGDQRKLYQSRQAENYYFKSIEPKVKFVDSPVITNETTYIRNITGSTDQNSFTGAIMSNHKSFTSDYSKPFWSVLALDLDSLCDFIIKEDYQVDVELAPSPISIIEKLEQLNKEKPVENKDNITEAITALSNKFSDQNYLNRKGEVVPISLYCSGLYLQLERLSAKFDMESAKAAKGGITGISKKGFTKKDFMDRYTTGKKKIVWGNPYIREEFVEGIGRTNLLMTKASGTLEININVDRKKAKEIKTMIDNAGVSSFYLGKKGLAYVTDIETREARN